jgi:Endonuclease/Exonuclease/phosphatase family
LHIIQIQHVQVSFLSIIEEIVMHLKKTSRRRVIATVLASLMLVGNPSLIGTLPAAYAVGGNVGTWNMQGSNASTENKWQTGVANIMQSQTLDVLALQEAGAVPGSASNPQSPANFRRTGWPAPLVDGIPVTQYNWLGTATRPAYYIYYAQTDPNGNRVNIAIVTRRPADEVFSFTPSGAQRSVIGVRFGNCVYFTVHARSGPRDGSVKNDGPSIVSGIEAAIDTAFPNAVWAALGDWNRQPGNLRSSPGFPLGRGESIPDLSNVASTSTATFPSTNPSQDYDYLVASPGFVAQLIFVLALFLSDHAVKIYRFGP